MNSERITWLTVSLFAIAMGLLEAIVVVYLRELYYPEGFSFPLRAMKPELISTELLRELATLIMLLCTGLLAGRNGTTRFAWFIFAFAVWDLFYYIFLKALLNWPDSFFTWDILFLIPITWVGPVLGPVINSVTMILLAFLLIKGNRERSLRVSAFEWTLLITGSLVVILSYTKEYSCFMMTKFSFNEMFQASKSKELFDFATSFVPGNFDWLLYSAGVLLHWLALGSVWMRLFSGEEVRSKR
jgi:hypothetical protein